MTPPFKYTKPAPIVSLLPKTIAHSSTLSVCPKPVRPIPWQSLPHITQKRLPDKPTDIRGIDSAGHVYVQKKHLYRKFPTVGQNKFFTLKFFPENHHLCSIRKSNVAFTFTNTGSAILNDSVLSQNFSKYKGKYSKDEFFKTVPIPCGTAASRDKNRKLIKRTLHKMLHEVAENEGVSKVSGIFFFRFHDYAVTEEQKMLLQDYMRRAVEKVCHDTRLHMLISDAVQEQNRDWSRGELLRGIYVENTLGATSVPGYFPKLPYLSRENKSGSGSRSFIKSKAN